MLRVLPGRKVAFRAGFWPDCCRESTEIGPPAKIRPGRPIYGPEALLRDIGYLKAVWPDLFGGIFEVWPAPGARVGEGGFARHPLKVCHYSMLRNGASGP